MSSPDRGKFSSIYQISDPKNIIGEDNIELHPKSSFNYGEENIRGVEFDLFQSDKKLGSVTALLTKDHKQIPLEGNLGIEMDANLRNETFLAKVATAMLPYFKEKKLDTILITFNTANRAVEKACTTLDATFLDTVNSGNGGASIKRYTLPTK